MFWDYETVVIPPRFSNPVEVSNAIVSAVSHYGRIVDRRMYMDFNRRRTEDAALWSALNSSGFDLVDTPARQQGTKETLDKKLIVDVLTFAWDSAVRNDNVKPVVVLLTSDGDYAYTLQKLRDRGVMAIVIYASDLAVTSILKAAADTALDFENDVINAVRKNNMSTASSFGSASSPKLRHKSSSESAEDDALVLVQVLLPLMYKDKAIVSEQHGDMSNTTTATKWVISANAASQFRSELSRQSSHSPPKNMKERYQAARKFAMAHGWVLQGRRKLSVPGTPIVALSEDLGKTKNEYSLEDFMSVTDEGSRILASGAMASPPRTPSTRNECHSGNKITSDEPDAFLFVKNISKPVSAKALARHIEQSVSGVTVVRLMSRLSSANPNSPFCFAKVQLGSASEAIRVLENGFSWRNRGVMITTDRGGSSGFVKSKGDFYYEKQFDRFSSPSPIKLFGDDGGSVATKDSGKDDTHKPGTYLYLKNVAKPVTAQELARHLEQSLMDVTIVRAMIPPGSDKWFNPFCFAKIQVESAAQAQLALEQSEKLSWRGRLITVSPDKAGAKGYADIGPDSYYERQIPISPDSEDKINTTGYSEIFPDASFERLTTSSSSGKEDNTGIIPIPGSPFERVTLTRNGDKLEGAGSSNAVTGSPFEHVSKTDTTGHSDIVPGSPFESITPTSIMDDASSMLFSDPNAAAFYEDLIGDQYEEDTNPNKPFYQSQVSGSSSVEVATDASSEINVSTNSAFVSNTESKVEAKCHQGSAGEPDTAFLFLKNVAKPVVASELAEHLQASFSGVTVVRAAIRPGPDPSFAFCFAKIQVGSTSQAKLLLEQSGILEWQGRALTILPDKMASKGFEDSYCLSSYKSENLKEVTSIGDDIEVLVRAADLMTRQGKHQDGWIDGGAFRTMAPLYFTPDRFKEARTIACVRGFLEIGRRHKLYGNIVTFDRNQFVGPQFSPNIYIRRTQKAIS